MCPDIFLYLVSKWSGPLLLPSSRSASARGLPVLLFICSVLARSPVLCTAAAAQQSTFPSEQRPRTSPRIHGTQSARGSEAPVLRHHTQTLQTSCSDRHHPRLLRHHASGVAVTAAVIVACCSCTLSSPNAAAAAAASGPTSLMRKVEDPMSTSSLTNLPCGALREF